MAANVFYLLDPTGGDLEPCETLEEALKGGERIIDYHRQEAGDSGWAEDLDSLSIYEGPPGLEWDEVVKLKLIAKATMKDVVHKPDDLDEDDYSESLGDHWLGSDFDFICDYEMKLIDVGNSH